MQHPAQASEDPISLPVQWDDSPQDYEMDPLPRQCCGAFKAEIAVQANLYKSGQQPQLTLRVSVCGGHPVVGQRKQTYPTKRS